MHSPMHPLVEPWRFPLTLSVVIAFTVFVYLRGWFKLRGHLENRITGAKAASFLLGLSFIWIALGSPLVVLERELLSVHMAQHLLLMTFAPPLLLLGAPMMALISALPGRRLVYETRQPIFRSRFVQRVGRLLGQPLFCWLASVIALIGWHIPAALTLTVQSHAWHRIALGSFLVTGPLFWWPVVQPWPSLRTGPRWSILLYLFLATLPCDILSGFLVFSERVVYPIYFSTSRQAIFSVLADQEFAAALMWTCVTVVYFLSAAILTHQLLSPPKYSMERSVQSGLSSSAAAERHSETVEV
jgi:putative membrane protein